MNILNIGYTDCAGVMAKWKSILEPLHTVRNLVYKPTIPGYDIDLIYGIVPKKEILRIAKNTDLFIFHCYITRGDIIFENGRNYYIKDGIESHIFDINWKKVTEGKKVYAYLNGSINLRHFAKFYKNKIFKNYNKVFCSTPDLTSIFDGSIYLPVPLKLTEYKKLLKLEDYKEDDETRICHCPSDSKVKNTIEFGLVCDELKFIYSKFKYTIISNTNNEIVLKIKRKCHMNFDHMQGYYGVNSLESAALGCVPLVGISDFCLSKFMEFAGSKDHPFEITRTRNELKDKIEYFINNKDKLKQRSKEVKNWMQRYWNEEINAKKIVKLLE